VLLKSVPIPPDADWEEMGRRGAVDRAFAAAVRAAPGLEVHAVNFRAAPA
jgi:hypothetical protein